MSCSFLAPIAECQRASERIGPGFATRNYRSLALVAYRLTMELTSYKVENGNQENTNQSTPLSSGILIDSPLFKKLRHIDFDQYDIIVGLWIFARAEGVRKL